MGMDWTDTDRIRALEFWMAGETAMQISKRFPGRSKNAIIGTVKRWRILDGKLVRVPDNENPNKRKDAAKPPKVARERAIRQEAPAEAAPDGEEEPAEPVKAHVSDAAPPTVKAKPLVDRQVGNRARGQLDIPFDGTSRTRCQWPGWNAGDRKSTMCGLPVPSGAKIPYCNHHYRASYNPVRGRK